MVDGILIFVLHQDDDRLSYERESFTIDELGGVVPMVGDLIAMSGVRQGLDRNEAKHRKIYEVTKRYFIQPDTDSSGPRMALVVKARIGQQSELAALGD